MTHFAMGIDIGGTNTKLGFVRPNGILIASTQFKTESEKGIDSFTEKLFTTFQNLLNEHALLAEQLIGIGIGAPDANSKTGMIENPNNLKWGNINIIQAIQKYFTAPIFLENDANISAIGEGLWGVAKGKKNYIVITLGTGVGTGIVINGLPYSGTSGLGGEGGHVLVVPEGRVCSCGKRGHLEAYASVTGIKKTIFEKTGQPNMSFRIVYDLFENHDKDIYPIIDEAALLLARGMSSMAALLSPDLFVISGGGANLGEHFIDLIRKYFKEEVYPAFAKDIAIELSQISTKDGAILGAASIVFQNF